MTLLLSLLLILSGGPTLANGDEKIPIATAYNKAQEDSPEKVAMQFVTAAFYERNVEKAINFVDRDAERKIYGQGSVIRTCEKIFRSCTVCWLPLTLLLFASGWGLWKGCAWARTLALVIYWPILAGAVILFATSLLSLALVPARRIAVLHVFAFLGLFLLPLIALIDES